MTPAAEQLVRETIELTGAEKPDLLDADAPVLTTSALSTQPEEAGFYLIGLIGGKDVGKSALVNAIVGRGITDSTSHGPGTEIAVAYAHVTQEPALRALLQREVPGRFRIVTHDIATLRRQVLLDLPDIDSHYQAHLAVTKTMLRHMLFPVWVQSIEKYADLQPQQMLARVAAGNAVQNFIFCLNKVDQLGDDAPPGPARPGAASASGASAATTPATISRTTTAARELRDDFAARLARTLALPAPPEVFLISARHPERYDLPRLRDRVAHEKTEAAVVQSKELASRKQEQSLVAWLAGLRLEERAERLERLREEAEELAAQRLAVPLVEQVLPRIADDPANRQALADDILAERVAHWPLVSLIHTLLAPLFTLIRTMGAKQAITLQGADALVEYHLLGRGAPASTSAASHASAVGWSAAAAVQSTFAALRQSQPALSTLYRGNKLWEDLPADMAASDLSRRLSGVVERQRAVARQRLDGRGSFASAPARWLLTIGAVLWFPLIQPILENALKLGISWRAWPQLLGLVVEVLGTTYLLRSAGFLTIYFLALWLALRWNTQRKVARMLSRWRLAGDPDPSLNLATQSLQWVEALTDPIRHAHERTASLAQRVGELRRKEMLKAEC